MCVCAMCVCYPAVVVQQTSGDDGVEEDLVGGYDVIQVLSPLHFVPKLVPGTFQHLDKRNQSMTKPIKMDDLVTLTFEKNPSGFRRWRLAEHNQYVMIPFLMIISSDHSDRRRCSY